MTDGLRAYFEQTFSSKGATVQVRGFDENNLRVLVSGLRGVILRGTSFWEQFEFHAIYFPVTNGLKLYVSLDGSYAATLGRQPPSAVNFVRMERDYYKEETEYLQELSAKIFDYLKDARVAK